MAINDNAKPCPNCGHCPTCGRASAAPHYVPYPWYGWHYYPINPYYTPTWINGGVSSMGVTSVAAGAGLTGTQTYTFTAS